MILVKATREGIPGGKTATGYLITPDVPFVALPSTAALRQWVRVYNPKNKRSCRALVLDVGPWNTVDHGYVFQPATTDRTGFNNQPPDAVRPQAESGHDLTKPEPRKTNLAGIDLSEAVWTRLGMTDNDIVGWEFD